MDIKLQASPREQRGRCSFCRDALPEAAEACERCSRCGIEVHQACAEEAEGRCTIFGCVGRFPGVSADRRASGARRAARPHRSRRLRTGPLGRGWLLANLILSIAGLACAGLLGSSLPGAILVALGALLSALPDLLQARALLREPSQAELRPGSVVALRGRPVVDEAPLLTPEGNPALWYRSELFERESVSWKVGRNAFWSRRSRAEYAAPFSIGGVAVRNEPAEVYGTRRLDQRYDPLRVRSWARVTDDLPADQEVTVLGRLDAAGESLGPDPYLGLLITAEPPRDRAHREVTKGLAALIAAAIVIAFILL